MAKTSMISSRLVRALRFAIVWSVVVGNVISRAQPLPFLDLTQESRAAEWGSAHDAKVSARSQAGLTLQITGEDPYIFGPAANFPRGQRLWLRMRLKSERGGNAQLFYFTSSPSEEDSVRFAVRAGEWNDISVPLPALGAATRFRFDPPGNSGTCVIQQIQFEARPTLTEPQWAKPVPPLFLTDSGEVRSGDLSLRHGAQFGSFELRVRDQIVAIGNTRAMLGYVAGTNASWLLLTNSARLGRIDSGLRLEARFLDEQGGHWNFQQSFTSSSITNGIEVETRVTVDQDRSVIFLPLLTILSGVGTFKTNKSQALLAGVEYLENEPSSSEADLTGPGARRMVPDAMKLTFPLMAIAAGGNYAGVIWNKSPEIAALHDSPDRIFNSGGHLMSLVYPGSNPSLREDGSVLPYAGEKLFANHPLILRATIIGGVGSTVVPAVQQFLRRHPLRPVPSVGYGATEYFAIESHAWLNSDIRDGAKFRHAVGPGFRSAPAADAAMYIDWLAAKNTDLKLKSRLQELARDTLALVTPEQYNRAAVGHIRVPAEALVYGAVAENAAWAFSHGRAELARFQDGAIKYQVPGSGVDLSRTQLSKEANGLAATHVAAVLECALFSGDQDLRKDAIRLLHALDKFRDSAPRGAQTWEVPLHTPDILASAYLVRAYSIGYELTQEPALLEAARYWAWTGVPFIYLVAPNNRPVGLYATTPVFGATQFVAPNWIGLPVQWCGLVYGAAIRRLASFDPEGPWLRLANGIAASGIQQMHTTAEPRYAGLLPDSFDLVSQLRNPVPINPATLMAEAIQFYGEDPIYDFRVFRRNDLIVHVPGPIRNETENESGAQFHASSWSTKPWFVLVNGFKKTQSLFLNGNKAPIESPHRYEERERRLVLQLKGPTTVEIRNAD